MKLVPLQRIFDFQSACSFIRLSFYPSVRSSIRSSSIHHHVINCTLLSISFLLPSTFGIHLNSREICANSERLFRLSVMLFFCFFPPFFVCLQRQHSWRPRRAQSKSFFYLGKFQKKIVSFFLLLRILFLLLFLPLPLVSHFGASGDGGK